MQSVRSRSSVIFFCGDRGYWSCTIKQHVKNSQKKLKFVTGAIPSWMEFPNGNYPFFFSFLLQILHSMSIFIRMRGSLTRFQALLFVREKENSGLSYKIVPQFKKIHLDTLVSWTVLHEHKIM